MVMDLAYISERSETSSEISPTARLRRETNQRLRKLLSPTSSRWSPRIPPDVRSVVAIARAADEGNEELVWRLAESELGDEPDSFLKVLLRSEFEGAWRRWSIPVVLSALRVHRRRLRAIAERKRPEKAVRLKSGWRTHGEKPQHVELRQALDQYTKVEQVTEVHRALFDAEQRLGPEDSLTTGKVDYRVREDNRPSHVSVESPRDYKPGQWIPQIEYLDAPLQSGSTLDEEPPPLSAFVGDAEASRVGMSYQGVESTLYLKQTIENADLGALERTTLALRLEGLPSKEIASILGDPTGNAVDQRMHKIRRKLRAAS